jgi:chemotaxis protein CheD
MEELVNGLLRRGSRRERLQVWIFGGANVLDGLTKIGDSNAEFARTFVRTEGYRLMGEETGGRQGRKLRFHAATGRSQVERLARSIPEVAPRASAQAKLVGDVELF